MTTTTPEKRAEFRSNHMTREEARAELRNKFPWKTYNFQSYCNLNAVSAFDEARKEVMSSKNNSVLCFEYLNDEYGERDVFYVGTETVNQESMEYAIKKIWNQINEQKK